MSTNLTIRLDPELKTEAEALFNELGMSLSTAFNVFLRQAVRVRGFPFAVTCADTPNRATRAALQEAERIVRDPDVPSYSSRKALAQSLEL